MTHQDTDVDTPYHGLTKPAFEKDPWDHDYYDLLDKVDDELILKDTVSNRPASPPNDSWFLATDEDILYYYDGSWRVIAGSDIQSSSDIDHDQTTGGTSGNPHSDSASNTDVTNAVSDHTTNDVHNEPQPNQNHGNEDHSVNYTTTSPSDVTSSNWGDYELQKDGTDGAGIINFKTN